MSKMLEKAKNLILAGDLVGIPTETVYGLAAAYSNETALQKIFSLKKRPLHDPLIVHVKDKEQAKELVTSWPKEIELLTSKFWPGPLTVILPKAAHVSDLISANLPTVALRVPNKKITLDLITATEPLAAPSANPFSKTSPTEYSHVTKQFTDLFVIDGGPTELGIESTVVTIKDGCLLILRKGSLTPSQIQAVLPKTTIRTQAGKESPGNELVHYQPDKPLFCFSEDNFTLANFIKSNKFKKEKIKIISLDNDPTFAAKSLYSLLHQFNEEAKDCLVILKKTNQNGEAWDAIWDRVTRACFKKN